MKTRLIGVLAILAVVLSGCLAGMPGVESVPGAATPLPTPVVEEGPAAPAVQTPGSEAYEGTQNCFVGGDTTKPVNPLDVEGVTYGNTTYKCIIFTDGSKQLEIVNVITATPKPFEPASCEVLDDYVLNTAESLKNGYCSYDSIARATEKAPAAAPTQAAPADATASGNSQQSHYDRVSELAPIYWELGPEEWLKAAGYTWDTIVRAARQPEEETFDSEILVSGLQGEVEGLSFTYPSGMTTDAANVDGRCYKPSLTNPSRVCTDVRDFTGTATLWVDVSNWGQLAPKEVAQAPEPTGTTAPTSAPTAAATATRMPSEPTKAPTAAAPTAQPKPAATPTPTAGIRSISQLVAQFGQLTSNGQQYDGDNRLAGAQITLSKNLTQKDLPGWVIQKNGVDVTEAKNGDVVTLWSPENIRPLAK